jgi:hypothetical protein
VTVVGDLHLVGGAALAVDLDVEGGEGVLRGVGDVADAVGRLEEVAEDVAVAIPDAPIDVKRRSLAGSG